MRNSIVALLVIVLMSQPVLVLYGTMAVEDRISVPSLVAAEPERGCPYSGDDLTAHVPIFINGTSDFAVQGWPGSGTPGNPYRIEKLNITYDLGLAGIRIIETQAYFVIRDCFVKQVSALACIQLYNVSHATIEYTTLISPGTVIDCGYANNLRISRSVADGGGTTAASMIAYASNAVLQWNLFSSTSARGLRADYCNDLQSAHNEFVSDTTTWNSAYLLRCDRASSQYDYSEGGDVGLYVTYSEDVTILGFEGDDNQVGIGIAFSNRTEIDNCAITSAADAGIELASCPDATIDQCVIGLDDESLHGIYADADPRITITNCHVTNAADYGIYISDSPNATIEQCTLIDCGDYDTEDSAIHIEHSGDTQVTGCQTQGTYGHALNVLSSERVTLERNRVYAAFYIGLGLDSCENATVSDNEITEDAWWGLHITACGRANLQGNTVGRTTLYGIYIQASSYISLVDNEVWDAQEACIWIADSVDAHLTQNAVGQSKRGFYLAGHTNSTVEGNTAQDVATGIYLEDVTGSAIIDNTFTQVSQGIYLMSTHLCRVEQNTVETGYIGMLLDNCDGTSIMDNVISGSGPRLQGVYVYRCLNLTFDGNEMTECGIAFVGNEAAAYYNHTFTGNAVNGLPVYYMQNGEDLTLSGSSYGQVIMLNCENVTVTSGLFYRSTVAVQAFYCSEVHLIGITSDESFAGLFLRGTSSSTMTNLTVSDSLIGMLIEQCGLLTIDSCIVSRSEGDGIHIYFSTNVTIQDASIEHVKWGVIAEFSQYLTVVNTEFRHISQMGILAGFMSDYGNVTDCEFYNITSAVDLQSPYGWVISDSVFRHCVYGIRITGGSADQGWVVRSEFYSNDYGISITSADYWHIINNTILWNSNYGVYMSGVTGPEVHGNTIALSGTANGYSNIAQYWDDGISRGNSWDDYVPPPPYLINVASDRYPSLFMPVEPIIDSPMDVTYPEFSTGNYITWLPFDDYLRDWTVQIDGDPWASGAWNFEDIIVNIDGLSYGTHSVLVTVWDVDMHAITDEVKVHVYDGTPPTVSNLPNTEAFVGALGQALVWQASDIHPGAYEILRNDVEVGSGSWTTGNISTSLDGLYAGVYYYTINVYDLDGNLAQDSVTVVVFADLTTPTIDSPANKIVVEGSIGNYVTWTPEDDHPSSYEVAKDGTVVKSGTWTGSKITFSVDGLAIGNYSFTLTVFDGAGHSASDSVAVNVIPYEGYTEPVTFDLAALAIAGAAIAGVVVVLVLVYYFRRRGK